MIRASSTDYDKLIFSQELSLCLESTLVKREDMMNRDTLAAIVIFEEEGGELWSVGREKVTARRKASGAKV